MDIKWLNDLDLRPTREPLMAVIHIDGSHAYVSSLDDGFEHHILLKKMTGTNEILDQYFRIIFDSDGADWTFVCPPDYKSMANKEKRIEAFYKDGIDTIRQFLSIMDYPTEIEIPKRYRRHLDYLGNDDY